MGTVDLPKKQKSARAAKPAAGSVSDSPVMETRKQVDARILHEETERVIRYLTDRVATIDLKQFKEKLSGYIERNFREISALYLENANDEMSRSIRSFVDGSNTAAKKSRGIGSIFAAIGKANNFNAGEIENAAAPLNGRISGLKGYADAVLQNEAGALVNEENSDSIIKCSFTDNLQKPRTVTDVQLRLNVPDSELMPPAAQYRAAAAFWMRELICRHIIDSLDREIDRIENREGIKISAAELFDKITALHSEADFVGGIVDNFNQNSEIESCRDKGFASAVNSLTVLLDYAKMDYQYVEKSSKKREIIIREYEDAGIESLPDERYRIRLCYYNAEQLAGEKNIYDVLMKSFESKVRHLWDIVEALYQDSKSVFKVNDYEDLARKNRSRVKTALDDQSGDTLCDYDWINAKLVQMRERTNKIYASVNASERDVLEERLSALEDEHSLIGTLINPHLLKPGIFIDLEMTTIKRKKTTLASMANVLNDFLQHLAHDFS